MAADEPGVREGQPPRGWARLVDHWSDLVIVEL